MGYLCESETWNKNLLHFFSLLYTIYTLIWIVFSILYVNNVPFIVLIRSLFDKNLWDIETPFRIELGGKKTLFNYY